LGKFLIPLRPQKGEIGIEGMRFCGKVLGEASELKKSFRKVWKFGKVFHTFAPAKRRKELRS